MNAIFLGSMAGVCLLALGCSVVSLLLHWARSDEHPDVSRLDTQMQELRAQQIDLLDRVEHWVKRDRVRKLREGREAASDQQHAAEAVPPRGSPEYKSFLRRKAFG